MAKYAIFFSLTSDAFARFVENPGDRKDPVSKLAEGAGGRLVDYYWMFGKHDGLVIVELPNSDAAAALALAVSSSGAFSEYVTHELIETDDMARIAGRAKGLRAGYSPPGGTG
jgi:uncharacterized protein with GYD domain